MRIIFLMLLISNIAYADFYSEQVPYEKWDECEKECFIGIYEYPEAHAWSAHCLDYCERRLELEEKYKGCTPTRKDEE